MNEPGDHSTPRSEQRQAVRYACILAAVDVTGQQTFMPVLMPGWPIRVLNISTHGIGIHAGDQLDEGTLLTIRLYGRSDQPSAPRQARIVHATQQADGTWIAGAAFIEPIGDDELQMLLGANDNNQ
jgi:PilZ domain